MKSGVLARRSGCSPERDTTLHGIGSAQDPTFELSVSVDPSAPNIWYDVNVLTAGLASVFHCVALKLLSKEL